MSTRRTFLRFLASSPLLAAAPYVAQSSGALRSAADALDVFDFEAAARQAITPAHWGYLVSGVDGEETVQANRQGFARYQLRPRRLVDVSKLDMSVNLFGTTFNSPILLAPVGDQKAFHASGEVAAARAAQAKGTLQILSTISSTPVEEVMRARQGPVWYQLYTTTSFDVTTKLVKRAEAAGCPVVVVTVDVPLGRNMVTAARMYRSDNGACTSCHGPAGSGTNVPMFAGLNMQGIGLTSGSLTGLHQAA
jgi:4-hydroxymandelate oxidase